MSKFAILGAGLACLVATGAAASDTSQTNVKTDVAKIEEKRVQKWEFHGCAAIPVIEEATAKSGKKPILKMAREMKETAKTQ